METEGTFEKAYSPKEVRIALEINEPSVLRKWCLALEENGYQFIKNNGQRTYVENDLVVLRHFQNLVKHHNMMLDNAAKLVVDRFGKGAFEVRTGGVPALKEEKQDDLQRDLMRSNENIMVALRDYIRTQSEVNQELLDRLERQENQIKQQREEIQQQQDYLKERFEQMEHERKLMESIRESQAAKQQEILLQIAAEQEEEKKKGFFARLFGK